MIKRKIYNSTQVCETQILDRMPYWTKKIYLMATQELANFVTKNGMYYLYGWVQDSELAAI